MRRCEWCGGEIPASKKPTTLTCSGEHKAKRWRFLNDYRGPNGDRPAPEAPPWDESPLLAAKAARTRSRTGSRARSGAQVSFRKAVNEVAVAIADAFETTDAAAALIAARGLRAALSPRQRERLEARDGS